MASSGSSSDKMISCTEALVLENQQHIELLIKYMQPLLSKRVDKIFSRFTSETREGREKYEKVRQRFLHDITNCWRMKMCKFLLEESTLARIRSVSAEQAIFESGGKAVGTVARTKIALLEDCIVEIDFLLKKITKLKEAEKQVQDAILEESQLVKENEYKVYKSRFLEDLKQLSHKVGDDESDLKHRET